MRRLLIVGLLLVVCNLAYGQTPISALPAASTSTTGLEPFPVVQSSATKKMTLSQVAAWLVAQNLTWTGNNTYANQITAPSASLSTGVLLLSTVSVVGSPGAVNIGAGIVKNQSPTATASSYGLVDGQAGNLEWDSISGYCNGAAPGTYSLFTAALGSVECISQAGAVTFPRATSVPWPKVAFGGWNGVGGCIQDTQIAISGFAAGGFTCTRLGVGQYQIAPLTGQFTQPPACTVSAGSGGGGGANSNSVQALEVGSSPPFIITLNMFNVAISFQDNHFILTCMGL